MGQTTYKLLKTNCTGSITLLYKDGVLSEFKQTLKLKKKPLAEGQVKWLINYLLENGAAKEEKIKSFNQLLDGKGKKMFKRVTCQSSLQQSFIQSNTNFKRFEEAYKAWFIAEFPNEEFEPLQGTAKQKKSLERLNFTDDVLYYYFKCGKYYSDGTLTNFVSHFDTLKLDYKKLRSGKQQNTTSGFPDTWTPEIQSRYTGEKLVAYRRHLRSLGWKFTRQNGIAKWEAPSNDMITQLLTDTFNGKDQ